MKTACVALVTIATLFGGSRFAMAAGAACAQESQCPPGETCSKSGDTFVGLALSGVGEGACLPRPLGSTPCKADGDCGQGGSCFKPSSVSSFQLGGSADNGYCIASANGPPAPTLNPTQNIPIITPKLQVPIPEFSFSTPTQTNGLLAIPFLGDYIAGVYKFLISIVSLVAAVMIMVGGFQYLTAGGDSTKVEAGKKRIVDALTGFVLAMGSYLILYTINPDLVNFKSLQILSAKQELYVAPPPIVVGNPPSSIDCSNPSLVIHHFDVFDQTAGDYSGFRGDLTSDRIQAYKTAAASSGFPWEFLAAINEREGVSGSILNGYGLCNTKNASTKEIALCSSDCTKSKPTKADDLACGVKQMAYNFGGTFQKDDVDSIMIDACKWNGCVDSWPSCPEKDPYVTSYFNQNFRNVGPVQVNDCVPPNCTPGCIFDLTVSPSTGGNCCGIKFDPNDSKGCGGNLTSASVCKTDSGNGTVTYTYNPNQYDGKGNPCGTWHPPDAGAPGVLSMVGYLLNQETAGCPDIDKSACSP